MGVAINGKTISGVAVNGKVVSGLAYNGKVIYLSNKGEFKIIYKNSGGSNKTEIIEETGNPTTNLANLKAKIKEINDAGTDITMTVECQEPILTSCKSLFSSCSKISSINLSKLNTSKVTDMSNMFMYCSKLTTVTFDGNNEYFNTSKVTNMSNMFNSCQKLTTINNLSNWNTNSLLNALNLFNSCYVLSSIDITGWDVSKVQNMDGMFGACLALNKVTFPEIFDTSNVISMNRMFVSDTKLRTLPEFNAQKVNDINGVLIDANHKIMPLNSLGGFVDLGKNYTQKTTTYYKYTLDLSDCSNLSSTQIMNVINNLYNLNNTVIAGYKQTLELGSTLSNKLSSSQKKVATDKGWTIV